MGWIPIGTYADPFKGSFDGDRKKITGLYIDDGELGCAGLFGLVSDNNTTIDNLSLENVYIYAYGSIGGIVGYITGGDIRGCYITGEIYGGSSYESFSGSQVGGVAGGVVDCNITDCHTDCEVNGHFLGIGGIAGYIDDGSNITNCYSIGDTGGGGDVGGIVGNVYYDSKVTNCYATGAVYGAGSGVGGVAGYVYKGTVSNCYSTGNVRGTTATTGVLEIGGVVGSLNYNSSVSSCYHNGFNMRDRACDEAGGG